MKPLTANLILLLGYAVLGFCWLFVSSESSWRWFGTVGGVVLIAAMLMLKRPDTGRSILYRNGLWVPFYIP
jgi:hypothetical protein